MPSDDAFNFVFTPEHAAAAVRAAVLFRLGAAFGHSDAVRVSAGVTPEQMVEQGWWFDTKSLHWLPYWWPEWSDE